MKLDDKQFARYKKLKSLVKAGKASEAEKEELAKLDAMKKDTGVGNPVELWNKYPTLFKDSTNIPFNYRKGTYFPMAHIASNEANEMPYLTYGVRVTYTRTPGRAINANDSVNYQARKLWTTLHRIYRGIGTYEYADLGIAMWAIINAFCDLARAERLYGLFNEYQILNRTVPEKLLKALKVDSGTITGGELADYRYQLNRIITKAKTLCLPAGISLLESFVLLESNVFKDSDSYRATWIVYDTTHRVQYDATASTGGRTIYVPRSVNSNGKYDFSTILKDLNQDFDILLTDTDIARICSDLLAAIGGKDLSGLDKLVTLKLMPEDYRITPIRDDSRLSQLHNTTLVGHVGSGVVPTALSRVAVGQTVSPEDTLQIYQDGGVIKCNFDAAWDNNVTAYSASGTAGVQFGSILSQGYVYRYQALLDIWKDDVSGDDVMEMTRQTAIIGQEIKHTVSGMSYYRNALVTYSNILCNFMEVFTEYGSSGTISDATYTFSADSLNRYSTVEQAMVALSVLTHIDWHPIIVGITPTTMQKIVFGDVDNFIVIDATNLTRLHDTAMLSGWTIPLAESMQGDR